MPAADGTRPGGVPFGYLDHACLGPPSRAGVGAVRRAIAEAADGRGSATESSVRRLGAAGRTRRALGALFGAAESDISLVQNTTDGLATVLGALPWRAGDAVVIADREFVGAMAVCRSLARARSLEVRVAAGQRPGQIAACLDRRARAVVVSAVGEVSGVRADLAAIAEVCAPSGSMLVVDGAQEAGVLTRHLPASGADAYAAGGQKWLRAPFGTGVLWTSPRLRERLVPGTRGYLALEEPAGGWGAYLARPNRDAADELAFNADGAALESGGTPNWLGAVGLAAAVRELLDVGSAILEQRALGLGRRLRDGLEHRGLAGALLDPAGSSALVSLSLAGSAEDVEAALATRSIRASVRGALGYRALRVSCHGWNTPDDIDLLLEAVDDGLVPAADRRSSPSQL